MRRLAVMAAVLIACAAAVWGQGFGTFRRGGTASPPRSGLVHHYLWGPGSITGTTLVDRLGNGDAKLTGRQGLWLDGINDLVAVGAVPEIEAGGEGSWYGVFRLDATSKDLGMTQYLFHNSSGLRLFQATVNNMLYFNGSDYFAAAPDTGLHRVLLTWKSNTSDSARVCIDGTWYQMTIQAGVDTIGAMTDYRIGTNLKGMFVETRLYAAVKSWAEVTADDTTGAVAWHVYEEGADAMVHDVSGHGHHGVITNAVLAQSWGQTVTGVHSYILTHGFGKGHTEGPELLQNGDAETGDTSGWDVFVSSSSASAAVSAVSDIARSGSYSIMAVLDSVDGSYPRIESIVENSEMHWSYTFCGYVRATETDNITYYLRSSSTGTLSPSVTSEAGPSWVWFSKTTGPQSGKIQLLQGISMNADTLWFDDFSVRQIRPAEPYIPASIPHPTLDALGFPLTAGPSIAAYNGAPIRVVIAPGDTVPLHTITNAVGSRVFIDKSDPSRQRNLVVYAAPRRGTALQRIRRWIHAH